MVGYRAASMRAHQVTGTLGRYMICAELENRWMPLSSKFQTTLLGNYPWSYVDNILSEAGNLLERENARTLRVWRVGLALLPIPHKATHGSFQLFIEDLNRIVGAPSSPAGADSDKAGAFNGQLPRAGSGSDSDRFVVTAAAAGESLAPYRLASRMKVDFDPMKVSSILFFCRRCAPNACPTARLVQKRKTLVPRG